MLSKKYLYSCLLTAIVATITYAQTPTVDMALQMHEIPQKAAFLVYAFCSGNTQALDALKAYDNSPITDQILNCKTEISIDDRYTVLTTPLDALAGFCYGDLPAIIEYSKQNPDFLKIDLNKVIVLKKLEIYMKLSRLKAILAHSGNIDDCQRDNLNEQIKEAEQELQQLN